MRRRANHWKFFAAMGVLGLMLTSLGCGPGYSVLRSDLLKNPSTPTPGPALPPYNNPGLPSSSFDPNLLQAILGTYLGNFQTLSDSDSGISSEPFQLTLRQVTYSGLGNTPYLQLIILNQSGSISYQLPVQIGSDQPGFYTLQTIHPPAQQNQILTDSVFSIEIDFPYTNGIQVDPTRSSIHIKDCVFLENSDTCEADVPDVSFVGSVQKR